MSLTSKITRLQLANLLYSPVSWAVLLVFALYSGILFTNQMEQMTNFYLQRPSLGPFTRQLVSYNGFVGDIVNLLFLFIPLLGMGLISNEMNSGTIKLLYSSPIKIRHIVLGKFWAMVVFNTLILITLLLIGFGASLYINHIDWGIVFAFSIGVYILSCTYSAVSLFMSSLTRFQIISAILSIALLYGLDYVGTIQTATPIISDILPWLNISRHSRNILSGYFISVDFIYFFVIIGLFLLATISKMKADRMTTKERGKITWQMAGAILVVVAVLYAANTQTLKGYADITDSKQHTLPQYGVDMLKRFKGEDLTLKLTGNAISSRDLRPDAVKSTIRGYQNYTRFKPDLNIEPSVFYAEPRYHFFEGAHKDLDIHKKMDLVAKYMGYDRDKVTFIDDLPEDTQEWLKKSDVTSGVLKSFSYNGAESFIIGTGRDDNAVYTTNVDDFTALTAFFEAKKQVTFLQGNKERQINRAWDTDWSRISTAIRHRFALIHNGFIVNGIDANTQNIPENTDILVIADPLVAYTETELLKIKDYINTGKNLFIAIDSKSTETLGNILEDLQIQILGEITSDEPGMIDGQFNVQYSDQSPEQFKAFTDSDFILGGAFALQYTGQDFTAAPVIQTKADYTWLQQDSTKTRQAYTTTLALTRTKNNKEQRLLVIGEADMLANKVMLKNKQTHFNHVHTSVFRGYFHWLTNGVYPIDMYPFRTGGKDNSLSTSYEKVKAYKFIYIGLVPLIIGLAGFFIWFKRSRK